MNITHMNEHEQWEAIKTWWKANGTAFIIIVILAVLASFGVRYWQQHTAQKTEQASALYDQLLIANLSLHSDQLSGQVASELEKDFSRTPYASLAALLEARQAVAKNNLALALQKLQWVIDHAKSDNLRQIARLRAARVLLALKQPQQALTMIEKVDDASFMPAINQVRGDIFLATGKNKEAKAAYAAALAALPPTVAARAYIQMQLNQLQ